jgi:3-methylfumaryl-CoA hydratase
VPLPRRMWAGSRVVFASPLQIGNEVSRVSTIQSVGHKKGRSGELVFVTVRHQIYHGERLAIEEEQDLVYRESATGSARGTAATKKTNEPLVAQWSRELSPDALLLFRYSALTFNSHRIHYDREYAVREEGYDGLVVQGPLTATLLLGLLDTELPFAQIEAFEFRAIRPLYEGAVLRLQGRQEGREVALWALDASGGVAMEARARLANE